MSIRDFIPGFASGTLRMFSSSNAKVRIGEPFTGHARHKRVLIVDDDPVIRETTSRALQRRGYTVRVASDCSEAIGAVGEARSDVIVLDLSFPPDVAHGGKIPWDGFDLMSWLRGLKNTEGARFIIISGEDTPERRQRAVETGASGFFSKPIDHESLMASIATGRPGGGYAEGTPAAFISMMPLAAACRTRPAVS